MIPTFKKGDSISASKINALGTHIKALESRPISSSSSYVDKLFFPGYPLGMDFAVELRKDDDGEYGICVHQGRVIVKNKEHAVGEKEWSLVASEDFRGKINLNVELDETSGEFISGSFSTGNEEDEDNEDTEKSKKIFPLAACESEIIWKHAGGPCYVVEQFCVVEGPGIKVKESREPDGKQVFKIEEKYSLSFVAGPGISIIDEAPQEEGGVRVVTIQTEYVLSLVAGPGIKIEGEIESNEEDPNAPKTQVIKISGYPDNMSFIEGPGILIEDIASGDDEQPRIIKISEKYELSFVAGPGIKIIQEYEDFDDTEKPVLPDDSGGAVGENNSTSSPESETPEEPESKAKKLVVTISSDYEFGFQISPMYNAEGGLSGCKIRNGNFIVMGDTYPAFDSDFSESEITNGEIWLCLQFSGSTAPGSGDAGKFIGASITQSPGITVPFGFGIQDAIEIKGPIYYFHIGTLSYAEGSSELQIIQHILGTVYVLAKPITDYPYGPV